MHGTSRNTATGLILALAAGLTAFGEGAAAEPRQAAGGSTGAPPCPTVADIEQAVGYPVKAVPVAVDGCLYELTGRYRGVFVSLLYQPATRANDVYADIRKRVKVKGMKAEPDRLTIAEGGWGYGSRGKKEAAAVAQGRLYHVEIEHNLFESLKLPDDAALRVIELGIRAAPAAGTVASGGAGTAGASLDACTLATNAEVSQIAEERPEIAKFWSAPTASFGGGHCDYDEAFFMIPYPNDEYKRLGLLAVYAGPRVVQLTLDANGKEPIEATRPRLERLAKLVLPRLR
jgi:hypothetical protein